ncbi:MAG TPA: hypothetical protein VFG66_12395 [Gemmatimonadales bacterium]|nr:hypothetical protein [Gemmatimonadales bacterium]
MRAGAGQTLEYLGRGLEEPLGARLVDLPHFVPGVVRQLEAAAAASAPIIDVGGGASTLVNGRFRLLESLREDHRTRGGALQAFVYCLCRVEARDECQPSSS